jgi:formiminoglutamase
MTTFLKIRRGNAPLILSIPHAGTEIPDECSAGLISIWRARRDADWHLPELYEFATDLDATIIATKISRTVIDVNRDPTGVSLYPGQATTELCPTTNFDGDPLYKPGEAPDDTAIVQRRASYFAPYHAAIAAELTRLRAAHESVVLYDCHSIRSRIPRLFDGELPQFNIGTNDNKACDPLITENVKAFCKASGLSYVANGRFKGGYITRHHGRPRLGIHAIQMELGCRGYMDEPDILTEFNWPTKLHTAPVILPTLQRILESFVS